MSKVRTTAMNKQELIEKQESLMQDRAMYENMQTQHSEDAVFLTYCQHKMDRLDEEAEQIRFELEMGCCD